MAQIAGQITTPFAMLTDNDDFLMPSALSRSAAFLAEHPEYVSHCGGVGGFEIDDPEAAGDTPLHGPITRLVGRYGRPYMPYDLGQETALGRLTAGYGTYTSLWYNVFRSDVLRGILENIRRIDFKTLEPAHEDFFTLQALLAGKHYAPPTSVAYFRQMGSSLRLAKPAPPSDPAAVLEDLKALLARMAELMAQQNAANIDRCLAVIRASLEERANWHLAKQQARWANWSRKHGPDRNAPGKGSTVHDRQEGAGGERSEPGASAAGGQGQAFRQQASAKWARMLQVFSAAGATADETADLDRDFCVMEDTLTGPDFIEFVRARAPELLISRSPGL